MKNKINILKIFKHKFVVKKYKEMFFKNNFLR